MRYFVTSVLLILIIIFTNSCVTDTRHAITSCGDGPYLFMKGDSAMVITQKRDGIFDSLYFSNSELQNLTFRYEFDGIPYPALSFKIDSQSVNIDKKGIFPMPDKVLAVSDIEGNYEKYYDLLLANNVIDSLYKWTFGKGHLVIIGDLVDRGNYVTQCLWLTYYLEKEAKRNGGEVHYLLGNHEQLLLSGYDNYCAQKYKNIFKSLHTNVSHMYSKQTKLGEWIRSKSSIIKIGDYIFVHAGISPSVLKYNLTMEKINFEVSRAIDTNDFKTNESLELLTQEGILWYRGLIEDDDNKQYKKATEAQVNDILMYFEGKSIVIGHTPIDSISKDYGGKVIRIDVDHYENSSALYIENGIQYIVDNKGQKRNF